MDRVPIPDDVSRFILLAIPSVPYLEAILLLRRDTSQTWDYKQIARHLYLGDKAAQALLAELHAGGIVTAADPELLRYRYHPQSAELEQMISRVAEVYSQDLIGVTNLIHAKANKKAQLFADAFIWRKES
ncbi:MAG TPA: hypothetical protein VFF81_09450 [Noviherbaspirillum sp.]|nr:hypothetical protein [Noviherbaspirillum sp.]